MSSELIEAGYTNVRRYQLGIPIWRALVGVTQIEIDGMLYVLSNDHTAVFIDARDREGFQSLTPRSSQFAAVGLTPGKDAGEIKTAKDDGQLPMEDHNTRIIVLGRDFGKCTSGCGGSCA